MTLQPNEALAEPVDFDMSGLYLVTAGGDFRSFCVLSVTPNSPAAEVAVREGDGIETINDQSAAKFTLEQLRQLLRKQGTDVSLGVKNGNDIRIVHLKLRRLI
jgi:C-terminal processing protease CtpA/Prc